MRSCVLSRPASQASGGRLKLLAPVNLAALSRRPLNRFGAQPQLAKICQPVDDALRCRLMCDSRRAGLQQRIDQSAQHVGLRCHGTEKIQSLVACHQQGREGFDLQSAHQISLILHIDPDKSAIRIGRCQRVGRLRKNVAIGLAGATPVRAQANHPRTNAAGRQS